MSVDNDKFANIVGYGGPGVSHLLIENQFGATSVDFDTFKKTTLELAAAIQTPGADYLRILHEADAALRLNVATAAVRLLMSMMLEGDDVNPISLAMTIRRVHQFVISYRRISGDEDTSWGAVLDA